MQIIGIVGGVASGKSEAARQFERLGAKVLDADRAGHEALRLPQIEAAAKERWGEAVFGTDGHIDRAKLARVVFAPGPEGLRERKYLEQLTHPVITHLLKRQAESLAASGTKFAVLDAALLLEAGWSDLCDQMVFIEAPREKRLERALARGWKQEDFAAREGAQDSLDQKRKRVDVIIDNSGSTELLQARIERFWASLLR
jgi:dephospho-CoA kinase